MTANANHNNANLGHLLTIRRYFLHKYHADGCSVLDCVQGTGMVWAILKKEFTVRDYLPLDVKAKKGRLQLDSVKVLKQPGWPQDVVDINTGGNPWKQWVAVQATLSRPTTVFLSVGVAPSKFPAEFLAALGLSGLNVPDGLLRKLIDLGIVAMLSRASHRIVECLETPYRGTDRYLGIRIEPTSR